MATWAGIVPSPALRSHDKHTILWESALPLRVLVPTTHMANDDYQELFSCHDEHSAKIQEE